MYFSETYFPEVYFPIVYFFRSVVYPNVFFGNSIFKKHQNYLLVSELVKVNQNNCKQLLRWQCSLVGLPLCALCSARASVETYIIVFYDCGK